MSVSTNIESPKSAVVVVQKLQRLEADLDAAIARGLSAGMLIAAGTAQRKYLSGPRPTRLDVVTTRLRNSISSSVETDVQSRGMIGRIGTPVPYAAFHEFGYRGTINVKAFTRVLGTVKGDVESASLAGDSERALLELPRVGMRRAIKDRTGRVIGFKDTNRDVARRATKGVSVIQFVKAHQRRLNYPGKPFLRPAVIESLPAIARAVNRELKALT